jgi:hypothetical protein
MLKSKLFSALTVSLAAALVIFVSWQLRARSRVSAADPSPVEARVADTASAPTSNTDRVVAQHAQQMLAEGQRIFRYDTFGNEAFWGDTLQLHKAIAGEKNGGVGPGVSPKTALSVGLKVDADALPDALKQQIKDGKVDLDDPSTTLALLKANSVVGVTGIFDSGGAIRSMGIQCAFCHSTVDDSFAPGIGKRLDAWANRDLNVGAIVSLAPNLKPFTDLLAVDAATVKNALAAWGPGRFDAQLDKDGKAFRPDGKQAGTLIPPAFGLAGINLHTWTGWGSVPYWNAYVAATEMHGSGTFFDPRLTDKTQFPVSARWRLPLQPRPPEAIQQMRPLAVKRSSRAKGNVRRATCRRSSLSLDTTSTPPRKSASILSRPIDHRRTCIAPRRSRACGRTKRAAFTMTVVSRRSRMSSTTTRRSCI